MSEPGKIHPTAVIDPGAQIAANVEIGPFCFIGENVRIGAGTVLNARVDIIKNTTIGQNCHIHSGAVLGGEPQDYKYKGEESFVVIGDNNILREYVTIHRAAGEGNITRLGSHNMLMAYVHVGHNCAIGSHVTIASYVGISGHVLIEDYATFGGICGVHQGSRIGTMAMIGGMSGVITDVYPYSLTYGRPAKAHDINVRGLRKLGVSSKVRQELKAALKIMLRPTLNMSQALEAIQADIPASPELEHLVDFIRKTREGYQNRGNSLPPM